MNMSALSQRDRSVLRLIRKGHSYPKIASVLGLSYETIKNHAARLRAKLGVENKIGLALYAQEHQV